MLHKFQVVLELRDSAVKFCAIAQHSFSARNNRGGVGDQDGAIVVRMFLSAGHIMQIACQLLIDQPRQVLKENRVSQFAGHR